MGFFDFLEKPFSMKRIGECVDEAFIHHGKILNDVQQVVARHARLSRREFEVGMLVVTGITNLEIGERLGISTKTVKAHRAKVMKKTESESLVDLVRFFDSYLSLNESDSSMR
jgi:FixJ family two-component response regulator